MCVTALIAAANWAWVKRRQAHSALSAKAVP